MIAWLQTNWVLLFIFVSIPIIIYHLSISLSNLKNDDQNNPP